MRYKRRKPTQSKYVSHTSAQEMKNAKKRARYKKISSFFIIIVIMAFCIIRASHIGIVSMPEGFYDSKPMAYIRKAANFASAKSGAIARFGAKGAQFCFDYLRGEDDKAEKVFAETEPPTPQADSSASSDALPKEAAQEKVFAPSMPCSGDISSPFGERVHPINGEGSFHNGIDIAANAGTEVCAIEDGTVEKSTYNQYSGNFVVIKHTGDYTSSYAHLAESRVSEGQMVKKGDIIGLVGSTGAATGPHLHMEIRNDGNPINPMELIGG
ncbi:MAG: M23 family metallopeptidase [Clostridia bacterium]|nr:M23 family metallopeptidase [Clostridia bacterium]